MSLFERVKKDILLEMSGTQYHSGMTWADIMLRNSSRLVTLDDQKLFWKFLLDPEDQNDIKMSYDEVDPNAIVVSKGFTMTVTNENDEKEDTMEVQYENTVYREGLVSYIETKPVHKTIQEVSELTEQLTNLDLSD